jgi:hypothetical protein
MEQYRGNRGRRTLMLCGLAISAAFGAWHFFIPYMFHWYSYIPNAPRTLVVSLDWTKPRFGWFGSC